MSKLRTVHFLGAGAMTPAFLGTPQLAVAKVVDIGRSPQVEAAGEGLSSASLQKVRLYQESLALPLGQKLKIAGDRIRLAETGPTLSGGPRRPSHDRSSKLSTSSAPASSSAPSSQTHTSDVHTTVHGGSGGPSLDKGPTYKFGGCTIKANTKTK